MSKTILIADDETDLCLMLRKFFELNGYRVLTAENGAQAIEKAGSQPDLILLDINMPDIDGIEVCKRLRSHVDCPILFLTARVEDQDKLKGFAAGGDDYIVKPFSLKELDARVNAHLRREERRISKERSVKKFDGELVIDYTAKEVYYKDKKMNLQPKEFEIIELLSMYPGMLFSKDRIFEKIWDIESDSDTEVITEHISKIRAKFAKEGCAQYIQTVWGSGYKWVK